MGMCTSKLLFTAGMGFSAGLFLYIIYGSNPKFRLRARKQRPVMGLKNLKATCYLNSCLQALASCNHFSQWLAHKDDANRCDFPPRIPDSYSRLQYPIIAVIYRAVLVINREIENDDDKFVDKVPADVISTLRKQGHKFVTSREQDTFEFFQFILEVLQQEVESSIRRQQKGSIDCLLDEEDTSEVSGELISVSDVDSTSVDLPTAATTPSHHVMTEHTASTGGWSVVHDPTKSVNRIFSKRKIVVDGSHRAAPRSPFQGVTLSRLQCLQCLHNTPLRPEPFDSVSLTLPNTETGDSVTICALIGDFLKPTIVVQVDCDGCSKKQGKPIKSAFSKRTYLLRLPTTLCLHVSRCSWLGSIAKRTEFVRFPENLNLSYLKRYHEEIQKSHSQGDGQQAEFRMDSADAIETRLRRFRDSQYRLVAVVSHFGDPENGHFVTYRRGPSQLRTRGSDEWFYVSDELVEPVSLSDVLRTKAYLIFYEKVHMEN